MATFELNSILEYKKNIDEMRKFARPDTSRHISDDIETEVVDSMVQAVVDNFDISHKWYRIKAKLL